MVPAVWAGFKGLSLAWKIAVPVLLVISLAGTYWLWKARVQAEERRQVHLEQQIDLTRQSEQTKEDMARQYALVQRHEMELAEKNAALEEKLSAAKRRLAEYEKKQQTRVDVDAVRIVNEFAGVLNAIPSTEERPADPDTSTGTVSPAQVGCATVTDLLRRNEILTERLAKTMIGYNQIWDYAKNKYAEEYLAYYGVPLVEAMP